MSLAEVARAIFYMHQTSGACAGVCAFNRTHQMEKTEFCAISSLDRQIFFQEFYIYLLDIAPSYHSM